MLCPSRDCWSAAGEVPAVKAYDAYVKSTLVPLAQSCDNLGGMKNTGDLLQAAWEGIRTIIVLASRSKLPDEDVGVALTPHLQPTQKAIQQIQALRLDRDWDRHQKALVEMLACLSWVFLRAPRTLPVPMIKETLSSAEFWSNRIRKDNKDKGDKQQVDFCNNIKKVMTGLAEYVETHHKTGLTFNARGVSLAEAAIRLSDDADADDTTTNGGGPSLMTRGDKLKSPVRRGTNVVAGGNLAGVMGELSKRKSSEGNSAATGLKHVCGYCIYSWSVAFVLFLSRCGPCALTFICVLFSLSSAMMNGKGHQRSANVAQGIQRIRR